MVELVTCESGCKESIDCIIIFGVTFVHANLCVHFLASIVQDGGNPLPVTVPPKGKLTVFCESSIETRSSILDSRENRVSRIENRGSRIETLSESRENRESNELVA